MKLSRFSLHARYVIWASGLAAMVAVILLLLSPFSPFRYIQPQVFDAYQRLHPRPYGNTPVIMIDIDEESISRIGQWPWSRKTLAKLTTGLHDLGAAVVAFDIIFSEPDRTSPARVLQQLELDAFTGHEDLDLESLDHDRIFSRAISRTPVVAGTLVSPDIKTPPPFPKAGISFGGNNPVEYLPDAGGALSNLPRLNDSATGIGVINFNPLFDGVVRKVPLLVRSQDRLLPSLAAEALRVAQGASGLLVRSTGASGETDTGLPAMVSVRIGDFTVPTSADGELWVYYSDGRELKTLPAHVLLEPVPDPGLQDRIAGHIVLVGASAHNLRDQRATPLNSSIAGMTIHAEILDQVISGVSLNRPDWAPGLEFVAIVLLGLLAFVAVPFMPALGNTLWVLLLAIGSTLAGWLAFHDYRLLLDPVPAVTGIMVAFGAASIARLLVAENQVKFVRQAFSQYLAPTLVDEIARKPEELKLSGETRQLTLLFCDIRNFTRISESLDPLELTRLLNDFLTPMTDVLMRNGATIDKYVGDMIMAFWNAPGRQEDHAALACNAALEMLDAMATLDLGASCIVEAGIGMNTGECCVGNLGSTQRFSYSAIGDAVNVAARVESLTKQYRVSNLITDTTANAVPQIRKLEVDRVRVVGRSEALTIYTMLPTREPAQEFPENLEAHHREFLSAYYAADFEDAERILALLLATAPESLSGLYSMFADRVSRMKVDGIADDWSGIYSATEK